MTTLNMRNLYKLLMMLVLAMAVSCGTNGSQSDSTGGITANLAWEPSEKITGKTVASAPVGVTTVRIIISGADMTTIQKDFTATSGSGTIDGVLFGVGRSLTAQGLDGSGKVIYQGSASNLTVQAGQTTNAGTITMAASPTVTGISPTSGLPGTITNITGSNFSTIPANNTVMFNGTPATVTAASATSLTVTVPSGASTGTVSVMTIGGTAVSTVSFTVDKLTITYISPTSGYPGTTINITGSNFSATPANNMVKFNGTPATVTAATATSLTVTVPSGATSGKVSVMTLGATAESTVSFTVDDLATTGQVVIWTRSYDGTHVYVDNANVGTVSNRSTPPTCAGGSASIVKTLNAGTHSITAYSYDYTYTPANFFITAGGGCLVYELIGTKNATPACRPGSTIACPPTCTSPQVLQNGVCVTPTPTCTSPQVLQNGVCVTPGTGSGGSGTGGSGTDGGMPGAFIGEGTGSNAAGCLSFGFLTATSASQDSQTITNNCSFPIYVMRCHTPSTLPGTADTQCNSNYHSDGFYQQFHWLQPGEVKSNFYSLPPETIIWYGACSGGSGSLPSGKGVSLTGNYVCN